MKLPHLSKKMKTGLAIGGGALALLVISGISSTPAATATTAPKRGWRGNWQGDGSWNGAAWGGGDDSGGYDDGYNPFPVQPPYDGGYFAPPPPSTPMPYYPSPVSLPGYANPIVVPPSTSGFPFPAPTGYFWRRRATGNELVLHVTGYPISPGNPPHVIPFASGYWYAGPTGHWQAAPLTFAPPPFTPPTAPIPNPVTLPPVVVHPPVTPPVVHPPVVHPPVVAAAPPFPAPSGYHWVHHNTAAGWVLTIIGANPAHEQPAAPRPGYYWQWNPQTYWTQQPIPPHNSTAAVTLPATTPAPTVRRGWTPASSGNAAHGIVAMSRL